MSGRGMGWIALSGLGKSVGERGEAGVIKDPWGRDYRIAVDVNGDGRVVTSCCGEITTTNLAVLWSVGEGPVTTWEYGQNLGGSVAKPASN